MIYLLYLIGLIFGVILSKNYTFNINSQEFSIKHLISVFSITYFMFFVLYLSKKTYFIYLLFPSIIFFRGFSLGILLNALLVNNFIWCLLIIIIEFVFIFSLFILFLNKKFNEDYKLLIIITLFILIYSILIELVGDKFGSLY